MSFDEAKSVVLAWHQNSLADAHRMFDQAVAADRDDHHFEQALADLDWQEVKSDPSHPEHDKIRDEHVRLQSPPDHRLAHDALDRAVRAADTALHTELRQIAAQHQVQMSVYQPPNR
jgi:hypothetical protein